MDEFEIIGPQDQPALLAISTPEAVDAARTTLRDMGYKVHVVDSYEQFDIRYNQINYQIVMIEETFAGGNLLENPTLRWVQNLPMNQRRHATFFLVGGTFETLNALQAFSQSVHCVINYTEFGVLQELVQKTVAENDLFLTTFREAQRRSYQKT
jgi:hypothetical protein